MDGLYVIIDRASCLRRASLSKTAQVCLACGVKILQLRDKSEDMQRFYTDASLIRKLTKGQALFIINDRADIAWLVDADGLHLGQRDLPIGQARKLLGADKIIGKSCHSLKEAISARKEGVDYISLGPIFATPTKPQYPAVGLGLLKKVTRAVKGIPVAAIGGINKGNIELVKKSGAKIFAVVRPVCRASDKAKAIGELNQEW